MPNLDVDGIKLAIINATFAYAESMNQLGRLSNRPMKDPVYQAAYRESQRLFKEMYLAINQLDALKESANV